MIVRIYRLRWSIVRENSQRTHPGRILVARVEFAFPDLEMPKPNVETAFADLQMPNPRVEFTFPHLETPKVVSQLWWKSGKRVIIQHLEENPTSRLAGRRWRMTRWTTITRSVN